MNELSGNNEQQAFVLRVSLSEFGVKQALECNQIAIGWSKAYGLLDLELSWDKFRQIISDKYYPTERDMRKAGQAAGHMWRFIRDMNKGDLVVVPDSPDFYVAEVSGSATYDKNNIEVDAAYRRPVKWINDVNPIPRRLAKAALVAKMNTYSTSAYATELLPEIKETLALDIAQEGTEPTFWHDLRQRLTEGNLYK